MKLFFLCNKVCACADGTGAAADGDDDSVRGCGGGGGGGGTSAILTRQTDGAVARRRKWGGPFCRC